MAQGQGQVAKAGKHDVALAERQVELAKVHRSVEIWTHVARGFAIALGIAACAIPLWVLQGVIEPLAGKETVVDANIVISITVAISVAGNLVQFIKGRSQKGELKRGRERVTDLEAKLLQ